MEGDEAECGSMADRRAKVIARLEARRTQTEKRLPAAGTQGSDPNVRLFQMELQQVTDRVNVLFSDYAVQNNVTSQKALLDSAQKECVGLDRLLTEHIDILPVYDARKAQQLLNETRAHVQALSAAAQPHKLFSFSKQTSTKPAAVTAAGHIHPAPEATSTPKPPAAAQFSFLESTASEYKNQTGQTIYITDGEGQEVRLEQLSDCVVYVQCNALTVYMHALHECTVLCRPVQTSVLIEGATHCSLVLAAQQLRIHETTDCDLYLHVTAPAIIEHCTRIRVAPYPYDDSLQTHFQKAGLSRDKQAGLDLKDFDWLATDQASPNWKLMGVGEGKELLVL